MAESAGPAGVSASARPRASAGVPGPPPRGAGSAPVRDARAPAAGWVSVPQASGAARAAWASEVWASEASVSAAGWVREVVSAREAVSASGRAAEAEDTAGAGEEAGAGGRPRPRRPPRRSRRRRHSRAPRRPRPRHPRHRPRRPRPGPRRSRRSPPPPPRRPRRRPRPGRPARTRRTRRRPRMPCPWGRPRAPTPASSRPTAVPRQRVGSVLIHARARSWAAREPYTRGTGSNAPKDGHVRATGLSAGHRPAPPWARVRERVGSTSGKKIAAALNTGGVSART
ncbi:hypothetical protein QFZ63_001261 [Streptomyces sp. B3I7]|nr:hypothetical protein [Streptomyces sp. B3I7]